MQAAFKQVEARATHGKITYRRNFAFISTPVSFTTFLMCDCVCICAFLCLWVDVCGGWGEKRGV